MFRERINNERGISAILMALSIVVLFGFGALALDVAHIYNVKNQLQAAADAAALAGCNELDESATGRYDPTQTNARQAAFRLGCKNTASVAENTIGTYDVGNSCTYPGCAQGNPIPIGLRTLQTDRDIEVGHWSGDGFTPVDTNTGTVINAVRVTARRGGTGAAPEGYQPSISTWFAKMFKLVGSGFDVTNITAQAVAARDTLDILPIAVNEYWGESGPKGGGKNPKPNPGSPYKQLYPESFMRAVNIDGHHDPVDLRDFTKNEGTRSLAGLTFPIIGGAANSNMGASLDTNGYVDILDRNTHHDPGPSYTWYSVNTGTGYGSCSPNCSNNLSYLGATNLPTVDNNKFNAVLPYLFSGIPDTTISPNAVREFDINMGRGPQPGAIPQLDFSFDSAFRSYTTITYNGINYTNDPQQVGGTPDNCPLATIAYFSTSGTDPLNKQSTSNQYFYQKYQKGDKFMVMVYDGTHINTNGPSQADVVTVIGYSIIQVDGYLSGGGNSFNGDPGSLGAGTVGASCYGHAVRYYNDPSEITSQPWYDSSTMDISDPYILQTSYSQPAGSCGFTQAPRKVAEKLSYVHLVGRYSIRYGVADHSPP